MRRRLGEDLEKVRRANPGTALRPGALARLRLLLDDGSRVVLRLSGTGTVTRIVSFIGVGLLMLERDEERALARVEPARGRDEMATELAAIRKAGYALTFAELVDGVCAIGAPVLDADGYAHASICVFGPQQRMQGRHLKDCIRLAVQAARLVCERLSAKPPESVSGRARPPRPGPRCGRARSPCRCR